MMTFGFGKAPGGKQVRQYRSSKYETRNKCEIPNRNGEALGQLNFKPSIFGFVSDFEFRDSGFQALLARLQEARREWTGERLGRWTDTP